MEDLIAKITSLEQISSLDDEYYVKLIQDRVSYLLDHEINNLFQILYKIDISEHKVKSVFQNSSEQKNISIQLTALIIERLKQKIVLRKKYSSKG